MKAVIIGGSAVGAAALILSSLTNPASARTINIGDGASKVSLQECQKGTAQTKDRADNCSYIWLKSVTALSANALYTYPTSAGAVTWANGTVTAANLAYPGSGQTWPKVTGLVATATATVSPKDITGKIDTATNRVELTVPFDIELDGLGNKCALTGTAVLSSDATDPLGGGTGKAYDPANGSFAVAAATAPTLTKTDTGGAGCAVAAVLYDLTTMGWYLNGSMELPGGAVIPTPTPTPTPTADMDQTAKVKVPKKLKAKGNTVILKKAVTTNAGQKATSKVSWSTKKNAKGKSKKFAAVKTTKSGKVTLTTTGKAKTLYVRLQLNAPAKAGYKAYSYSKNWTVKK